MTIAICGGGSQAHALAAAFGANSRVKVRLLSRRPREWKERVVATYLSDSLLRGRVDRVSAQPAEIISQANVVLVAVPAIARSQVLKQIQPYLRRNAWLGCIPGFGGFAWQARSIVGSGPRLFGFQRVPFVCKKVLYGEAVEISGVRPKHFIGAHPKEGAKEIAELLAEFGSLYTVPMGHYLNVCLSRSNSMFHPARLYSLFRHWPKRALKPSLETCDFYRDWNRSATIAFGKIEEEVRRASAKIPLDLAYAVPLLQHYEVAALKDLTARIRGLRPLWNRAVPVCEKRGRLEPDLDSFYFTEDIPYGLVIVKSILELTGSPTPFINSIISWAQSLMGREFLVHDRVAGRDSVLLPTPQNHGIKTVNELVEFCLRG